MTKDQEQVYLAILNNPGIGRAGLIETTGNKKCASLVQSLARKELVRKKGTRGSMEYYTWPMKYTVATRGEIIKLGKKDAPKKEQPVIKIVGFTAEQKEIVKRHKHKPRSELARMLKMNKIEFNLAMEKYREKV